jgi:ubiquinone/menaquinone biosynthesis C-methylase UbiE
VEIANVEQAAAWDGEEGARWAEQAAYYDRSVRRHSRRLRQAARIQPDERVVDIGCGCGETTRDAARLAPAGRALGLDLSSRMLALARERSRAEGLSNVSFERADAQVYAFESDSFDLAISRFGAMFFADPLAAFGNLKRGLRPGGRLALLAWQELARNEWLRVLRGALAAGRALPDPPIGTPGPFGLAQADRVRRLLTEAGFESVDLEEVREPIYVGADAADAFRFTRTLGMTKGLLDDLDEAARATALETLRQTLAAHASGDGVQLESRAWLITARRPLAPAG